MSPLPDRARDALPTVPTMQPAGALPACPRMMASASRGHRARYAHRTLRLSMSPLPDQARDALRTVPTLHRADALPACPRMMASASRGHRARCAHRTLCCTRRGVRTPRQRADRAHSKGRCPRRSTMVFDYGLRDADSTNRDGRHAGSTHRRRAMTGRNLLSACPRAELHGPARRPAGLCDIPMIGLLTRGSTRNGKVFPCRCDLAVALGASLARTSRPSTVTGAHRRLRAARSSHTVAGPCGILTHFPESSGTMQSAASIAPPPAGPGPVAPSAHRTSTGRRDRRLSGAVFGRKPPCIDRPCTAAEALPSADLRCPALRRRRSGTVLCRRPPCDRPCIAAEALPSADLRCPALRRRRSGAVLCRRPRCIDRPCTVAEAFPSAELRCPALRTLDTLPCHALPHTRPSPPGALGACRRLTDRGAAQGSTRAAR